MAAIQPVAAIPAGERRPSKTTIPATAEGPNRAARDWNRLFGPLEPGRRCECPRHRRRWTPPVAGGCGRLILVADADAAESMKALGMVVCAECAAWPGAEEGAES